MLLNRFKQPSYNKNFRFMVEFLSQVKQKNKTQIRFNKTDREIKISIYKRRL